MVEPEMAYVDFDGNLKVQEELITKIIKTVLKNRKHELSVLERDTTFLEKN